jgi:hypothetical protein
VTHLFLGVIILCFVVGLTLDFFNLSRSTQRRLYWAGAGLAAIAGFLMVYPNWKNGLAIAGILFAAMTIAAYAATPYVKIGGKTYALTVADCRPDQDGPTAESDGRLDARNADPQPDPAPDSYAGMLTATTMWWLLVGLAVITGINAYAFLFSDGNAAVAAVGTGFLALLAIGTGYGDASWDYRIARGQYLQLGIASIITAGSFALVYLAAYCTARRCPWRRKQSMQSRAHPRHRKTEQ